MEMPWAYDTPTGSWSAQTDVGRYKITWSAFRYVATLDGTQITTGSSVDVIMDVCKEDRAARLARHAARRTVTTVDTDQLVAAINEQIGDTAKLPEFVRAEIFRALQRLARRLAIDPERIVGGPR